MTMNDKKATGCDGIPCKLVHQPKYPSDPFDIKERKYELRNVSPIDMAKVQQLTTA